MTLDELNQLASGEAEAEFLKCCGSHNWARSMAAWRPFDNEPELFAKGEEAMATLVEPDWLEAFRAHPKIGEKKAATPQSQVEANWSAQEQAGVQSAAAGAIAELARANQEYEAKFGFIFIVCASGKSSDEMLSILQQRLNNDPPAELFVAAREQQKITRLRLEKLLAR